jgi:hypothetical protein
VLVERMSGYGRMNLNMGVNEESWFCREMVVVVGIVGKKVGLG